MTGLVGGAVTGRDLDETVDALWEEPWYGREELEIGDLGFGLLHHGERDPESHTAWEGDGRVGVIYGAVSNLDSLDMDREALFDGLLERPAATLSRLNGSFLVAAGDSEGRLRVATDRLGSRSCFYATRGGLRFGSEIDAPLTGLDDPELDHQGVSDLLLMGNMWEDHTLVEGVSALRPATVLEYEDGEATTRRYWTPEFEPLEPGRAYVDELVDRYRRAVGETASTMSGTVGVWLSGGLDSRSLVGELAPHAGRGGFDRLVGYTYDANPAGGGNPKLARRVAESVGADLTEVEVSPDRFLDAIERSVAITGGMLQWNTVLNLSSVFNLGNPESGVMLEGSGQGELIGNHLRQYHFRGADSLVESLCHSETSNDVKTVCELLEVDVNPLATFKESAERSGEMPFEKSVLDAHFQNYYARNTLASDQLARSQVGTRVPYLHGDFLEHAARLPVDYRMGTVPYTGGSIPYGVSPAKLGLMRGVSEELSEIPYERTNVPPNWPWEAHVAGFIGGTGFDRLRSKTTYGGWGMPGVWYRDNAPFRRFLNELIDDACDRDLFNADALRRAQDAHLSGERDMIPQLGPVTTIELWLQSSFDDL